VCTPAQVSVPVIVPAVVSFDAETVPAGNARESNTLIKNRPVKENDRNFSSRAITRRTNLNNITYSVYLFLLRLRCLYQFRQKSVIESQ
jgi:hypothetical protein